LSDHCQAIIRPLSDPYQTTVRPLSTPAEAGNLFKTGKMLSSVQEATNDGY